GTEHWVSQSESDAEAGLGRESANKARFGDAFDLYVHYEHNGDRHAALLAWQAEEARRQQAQVGESAEEGVGADAAVYQSNTIAAVVDWSKHGDVRNAAYFADSSAGEIAYIPQQQRWMQWQNSRWAMCLNGEEVERTKEVCEALYVAAGAKLSEDPEKGQKYVREAAQAHLLPRIRAMLELAKSDPKLVVSASKLDAKPLLLGVGNGVVDLRRKRLLPNEPGYFITRYCYADFDPSAQCPSWLRSLDAMFQGDTATIDAVQLLLGYTLTGYSTEEIMIFCVGFGANGKSIFGNVVAAILGDYSRTAPSQLLASRRTDDHGPRNDMAMLDGARLVSINELPAGMHLDEQVVKQLAGREPISARFLHKEYFTYEPRFTPWVRTNHKPIVKGDDEGIWRRIVILPFRRTFAPHEQDPHLEGKLLRERDGILAWMVEGAQRYLREGLKLSPAMKRELAQYRTDSDMLGEFLAECTATATGARVEQKTLFLSWQNWCKDNGVQPGSKKTFTQRLKERGFPPKDSNGKRYYQGLRTSGGLFPHSAGSAG
ncbi:MAG: hypothetical protein CFE32_14155, partial [Alphaproteobacteria bacterium PA3]